MEDEIDLKQYLDVIIKHWKIIALVGVIAASIGLYQGVKQPKLYKATATIMVTDSGGGGLGSALSAMSFLGGGGASGGEGKLTPILKSRALAKEVAKSLDLNILDPKLANNLELTQEEKMQAFASRLNGAVEAKMGTSGLFEISMTWNNPKMAAELANKYVEGLGRFLNSHALNINFQSIDPALPPQGAFNRNPKQNALVGLGIGLFAGALMAFSLEYWLKIKKS